MKADKEESSTILQSKLLIIRLIGNFYCQFESLEARHAKVNQAKKNDLFSWPDGFFISSFYAKVALRFSYCPAPAPID
ncbi:hypothetical protein D4T97_000385 [Siminovitchia acidinfaciens]|uniref:Uncharacterized protein n=1 Tax=Siminovitchia acidinfaciens TaxID=2321395 RepID=A0A429Y6H7_9BACI|nr:hypothetical protein D4T97_000385 [Siminovitchia acidinfaciens]